MANTYITTNTRFKPFSFQEMLQPYQMYTEAYDKADAELNTLLEDAAIKGFNFAPHDTAEAAAYFVFFDDNFVIFSKKFKIISCFNIHNLSKFRRENDSSETIDSADNSCCSHIIAPLF